MQKYIVKFLSLHIDYIKICIKEFNKDYISLNLNKI